MRSMRCPSSKRALVLNHVVPIIIILVVLVTAAFIVVSNVSDGKDDADQVLGGLKDTWDQEGGFNIDDEDKEVSLRPLRLKNSFDALVFAVEQVTSDSPSDSSFGSGQVGVDVECDSVCIVRDFYLPQDMPPLAENSRISGDYNRYLLDKSFISYVQRDDAHYLVLTSHRDDISVERKLSSDSINSVRMSMLQELNLMSPCRADLEVRADTLGDKSLVRVLAIDKSTDVQGAYNYCYGSSPESWPGEEVNTNE